MAPPPQLFEPLQQKPTLDRPFNLERRRSATMRIAVVGTHGTGKSTLIAGLAGALPQSTIIDEAYDLVAATGEAFAHQLDAAEFEGLCERAGDIMEATTGSSMLFDRSPLDYLAYRVALSAEVVPRALAERVHQVMSGLDLIAYVPLETPDRIAAVPEAPRLRRRVDAILRDWLVDDGWGWGLPVLEVQGSPAVRVQQVRARLGL